ncbi:hypothetical protein GSI_05759 [Ganoderma sinense ZZ0214-1]|uniref:Uncharacterized protein n=1 Tax=Ganoderma sinense ZZ0214-1 TaxID=1077348 RepID=A0A2G8SBE9_9APHY|nr:hypothetical protein GSI_05759 [Ganoderma sinense ZZ0214-1]
MPPQRSKLRRTTTLTGSSFYDKSGAIGDTAAAASSSATSLRDTEMTDAVATARGRAEGGNDTDDDECCLTGYGEMSSDAMFMLPPSPTQTIQYRYPAYRAKLAKMNKKRRAAAGGTGKTKSSAYHNARSDYASLLGPSFEGLTGLSPKREFQALLHKYRDSAEGWRDTESHTPGPSRKTTPAGASAAKSTGSALRREGSRLGRNAF